MSDAPVDGRVRRGERTRAAIVAALLDLLNDGVRSPTTARIAERAGVSVRSVFQHFEDLEALYADLAAEQARRVDPLLSAPPPEGSTATRIRALAQQRRELFETIAPVRHAIGDRAAVSPALRARLDELSVTLRTQLVDLFAAELATLGGTGGAPPDDLLVDAVDMVASFEAWDRLRVGQGLGPDAAERVVVDALARLLCR